MNIIEVQNLIVESFDTFWIDTAVEHANITIDKSTLTEFVRLTILHDRPKPFTLCMRALRGGSANVQIFTKMEIGQGRAMELAKKAGQFLSSLSTGQLTMKPYDIVVLGNKATAGLTTTETPWFQINCIVDFTYID